MPADPSPDRSPGEVTKAAEGPGAARDRLIVRYDGTFVPGLLVAGLRELGTSRMPRFPWHAWASGTRVDVATVEGLQWEVVEWRIAVAEWPPRDRFPSAVRQTLEAFVVDGFPVAWLAAGEGTFREPPDLFQPEAMSGAVLAAATAGGWFACAVDPDLPVAALPDDQLVALREASAGLAEVL